MYVSVADDSLVPFVSKVQKARTRKGMDYFVMRMSIPKEAAKKLQVGPGDYLLLQAKKAEWYHLLDWSEMKKTWPLLPSTVKNGIINSGLFSEMSPSGAFAETTSFPELSTSPTGQSSQQPLVIQNTISGGQS
jgi:hypothetical protein